MMKLRFEQVLNYLESREKDPEFEQFLKDHPDGPRMLQEAKLLHGLLANQAEEDTDDFDRAEPAALSVADSGSALYGLETSDPSFERDEHLMDDEFRPVSSKEVMAAASLAQRVAGRMRTMGELTIGIREADVLLEFHPSLSRHRQVPGRGELPPKGKGKLMDSMQPTPRSKMRETDQEFMAYMSGRTPSGEIRIRGSGIEIWAPGVMDKSEVLALRIVDTRSGTPARGLEMIFMPETGPFIKIVTNSKGVAELPITYQPGLLRVEGKTPEVLQIRFADYR